MLLQASASHGDILQACSFERNAASMDGGAVYAYDNSLISATEVHFGEGDDANTAAHGGMVSTPPKRLVFAEPLECIGTAVGDACHLTTTSGAQLPRVKVCPENGQCLIKGYFVQSFWWLSHRTRI